MSVIDDIDCRLGNLLGMLDRLELDPVAFSSGRKGLYLAAAIPGCLSCSNVEQCRKWLDDDAATEQRAPDFCPNVQIFGWAREDQQAWRK
ncbi:MAG TPA: DUF6455 family protein [Xanthobacteraceae bacterium]|jgi:hypothetical protein